MKRVMKVCFFLAMSCLASLSFAEEELLDGDDKARIDYVDLNQRNIVIDDWQYHLALDLKVHGVQGLETDFALKEGLRVKYEVSPSTSQQDVSTIVDIWILQE